jgi:hypothetical protein
MIPVDMVVVLELPNAEMEAQCVPRGDTLVDATGTPVMMRDCQRRQVGLVMR